MKRIHYRNVLSNGMETNLCPNISYHPILTDDWDKVTCEKCMGLKSN